MMTIMTYHYHNDNNNDDNDDDVCTPEMARSTIVLACVPDS